MPKEAIHILDVDKVARRTESWVTEDIQMNPKDLFYALLLEQIAETER